MKRSFPYWFLGILVSLCLVSTLPAQSTLDLDRIFISRDFAPERVAQGKWVGKSHSYEAWKYETGGNRHLLLISDDQVPDTLLSTSELLPEGATKPLRVVSYTWSKDRKKMLIFTNTRRVWRQHTRGDYWVWEPQSKSLHQLGQGRPEASLMFAKFSPDGTRAAYVSEHNLYVEDLKTGMIQALTHDGSRTLINGTFDWAYEEEFFCRDGFRWSPDGKQLVYWQVNAAGIRDFLMINNTDSVYSYTIPVQYPKVGETPSSCRIGVVAASGGATQWLQIPGDARQHYLPRLLWAPNSQELLVQQLNRKQNTLKLWRCRADNGEVRLLHTEQDDAWIDLVENVRWLNKGNAFSWLSEANGWRQIFQIDWESGVKTCLTPGEYDVIQILRWDKASKQIYFLASPDNATQRYLYVVNEQGEARRLSPDGQAGTHAYQISPDGSQAFHIWSSQASPPIRERISLPDHERLELLTDNPGMRKALAALPETPVEYFQVTTEDGVTVDGYQIKPPQFDPTRKYPVLFYVYGEPWGQTTRDTWGGRRSLWHRMLAHQGYLVMSLDNRGSPAPKGRTWRKAIYRQIGRVNIRDQAMAAKVISTWDYVDPDRIAVWGWSGGGSSTLNLLFQYPEIYQTGMSVAPVANQLYYDNIYQERYMGLPQENREDFVQGSPVTHAHRLAGNLLLVHGTADDNVHYQNSEALINELIKHNKIFQMMPYPNRSHGIFEGANTTRHLFTLLTHFLHTHSPPGPKS